MDCRHSENSKRNITEKCKKGGRNGADTSKEEMTIAWEDEKWTWNCRTRKEKGKTKVEVAGMFQRRNA